MRPHVELDGGVELRTFEAVSALQRDYAWAIDLELCVFPQEGLTNNPRADELLVAALQRGARVIGAAPNFDPDHAGQLHRVFDLARETMMSTSTCISIPAILRMTWTSLWFAS